MARTSFQNIVSLPDAAQSWNFGLFIPTIPGGGPQATNLTYRCKATEFPGSQLDVVSIDLAGVTKKEAGRAIYSHTFTATFLETVDWSTSDAFRGWRDSMRSWKRNAGTNSASYKQNLELDLYDFGGNVVKTIILVGAWVTEVGAVSLDGGTSDAIMLQLTFSFDAVDDGVSL